MEIKCNYANDHCHRLENLYTCWINSASIKEPNQEIKAFVGEHKAGKTDRDVEFFCFLSSGVHYMPRGISKIFPNLKAFWIIICGLKKISREDLVGLENIEELNLNSNLLKSLPDDLLEGMKKLKVISFNNNRLEFVSSQLLQPVLNQLTCVDFRNNPTIDAAFDAYKVFTVFPSDRFVDLPGMMKLIDEKCKKLLPEIDQHMKAMTSSKSMEMFCANLLRGLKDLWTSRNLSDFTIIVADHKFPVHKCVLAFQSDFFAKTFNNSGDNSVIAELKTEDFSVEAVAEVLNWMYTGKIPDTKNSSEIFSIAMKLEISGLKPIADKLVLDSINKDNAMETFKLGHRHNSEMLKKSSFKVIKEFLADPNLEDEMMDEPEKLEKLVEVKKIYEEIKKSCKKRKLSDI